MWLSRVSEYQPGMARGHRSAVSFHCHSYHSKEVLHFLPAFTGAIPVVGRLVRREMARYKARHGRLPEFTNAYWVPPFSPAEVLESERANIASRFGLPAIVSLTDHDTIEGGLGLRAQDSADETVLSVEWTVPYRGTNFHLGVHNMPPHLAVAMMREFDAYRMAPAEPRLGELLAWVHEQRDALLVMNHALWNANGNLGQNRTALDAFIQSYRPFVHATELNGYRVCAENREVLALAHAWQMPVVAGGDRHGRAPNALVNLSQATTVAEFVDEVRRDQQTHTVALPEYRDHRTIRVAETVSDALRPARPGEPGQRPWLDRVFIIHDDGHARPIADQWSKSRCPWWVQACVRAACVAGGPLGQRTLRLTLAPQWETTVRARHSPEVADQGLGRSSARAPAAPTFEAVLAITAED